MLRSRPKLRDADPCTLITRSFFGLCPPVGPLSQPWLPASATDLGGTLRARAKGLTLPIDEIAVFVKLSIAPRLRVRNTPLIFPTTACFSCRGFLPLQIKRDTASLALTRIMPLALLRFAGLAALASFITAQSQQQPTIRGYGTTPCTLFDANNKPIASACAALTLDGA